MEPTQKPCQKPLGELGVRGRAGGTGHTAFPGRR